MSKIQISMNDELLKRADNYADENGLTRSGLITTALVDYLSSREVLMLVKNLSLAIGKISETGNLDDETMNKLEDFERATRIMFGK
jgi:metal-responsive CopG/Arc/MetJ family transcriptional regulator